MTEYGRSPGSEPWHPTDPSYGDQGWEGQGQQQYPQQGTYGHADPYTGGAYQQQYPQQHHPQEQAYGARQAEQAQEPQQPHPEQQPQQPEQYGNHPGGYDAAGYPAQQYDGNWETSQAAMPYSAPPADPYGGQQPDLYGTPEAYPPPQPPGRRPAPQPNAADEWEAEPEPHDEDDDPAQEPGRGGRGSRSGRDRRGRNKGRKGKNGVACLVVATVIAGGVGGVAYFGYKFWQGRFAAAPDYVGEGTGSVEVEIPDSAGGYQIGNILKKAGVVKSVDAFVSAQQRNPKGITIQAGAYTLKKEMSADKAVALLLNPASQANFVIPEGKRNAWIYEQIDKRLDLEPGTTKSIAFKDANKLGLPDWAKNHPEVRDPLEGFLFPASYPVAKGTKPEDALRRMVARANSEYAKLPLQAKAQELGLKGPWQLVTVASLVQVEGKYKHDFDKVSRVVYNRLKPDNVETVGRLEFDSTVNYLRGQNTLDVGTVDKMREIKDPYNTYHVKGLVPGPISNPGLEALNSAMDPEPGPWYYFVSIDENKTVFSETNEEHNRNVAEYEKQRKSKGQ